MSHMSQVRRTRRGRSLSPSRLRLLETIEGQPEPLTLAALVKHSGLHENTVRGHLEQLMADRYITRSPGAPAGRGRPAWLWSAIEVDPDAEPNTYAQLAAVLAKTILETSSNPAATATQAGRDWGAQIARSKELKTQGGPGRGIDTEFGRTVLVGLLDDLGFAPAASQTNESIELKRCPLLQTATQFPEVVCSVHLGLIHGAAQEIGLDSQGTTLIPFTNPGVCSLHLALQQSKDQS